MDIFLGETRAVCDGCGQQATNITIIVERVALCGQCLGEYEEFRLQFPNKTIEEFVSEKRMFFRPFV